MGGENSPLLSAQLDGIALTSSDVKGLVGFYVDTLGYDGIWSGESWVGRLDGRWLKVRPGTSNLIDHAAFAVEDQATMERLRDRLDSAQVAVREVVVPELDGVSLEVADPDGNGLIFGLRSAAAAGPSSSALKARLQHVVYASDAVGTMLRFYCDVLGFAPSDFVQDEQSDLTSAFLRCSDEHHSLAIFRASRKRLDHFCYDVHDWAHIRDWADRFAAQRLPLKWGPGRHGPGNNLFLFVNDPDSNWLEFSAELERVEGERPVKQWVHEERTLNSWGSALMRS